ALGASARCNNASRSSRNSLARSSSVVANALLRLRAEELDAATITLHRERRTAAAGRLRVRVADHELRAMQAFAVIDLGAHQVLQAERIDDQRDAFLDHRQVVVGAGFV